MMKLQYLFVSIVFAYTILQCIPSQKNSLVSPRYEETLISSTSFGDISIQEAVRRGLRPGGDLVKELSRINPDTEVTHNDIGAILNAFSQLSTEKLLSRESYYDQPTPLSQLSTFLRDLSRILPDETKPLIKIHFTELLKLYDSILARNQPENEEDLLRLLACLVTHDCEDTTRRVLDAIHRPLSPFSPNWRGVFDAIESNYSQEKAFFKEFQEHLPPEPIACTLLTSGIRILRDDADSRHPFNSLGGQTQLAKWIGDPDHKYFERATTAIDALEYMDEERRNFLVDVAFANPNKQIQLYMARKVFWFDETKAVKKFRELYSDVTCHETAAEFWQTNLEDYSTPILYVDDSFLPIVRLMSNLRKRHGRFGRFIDNFAIIDEREVTLPQGYTPEIVVLVRYQIHDKFDITTPEIQYVFMSKSGDAISWDYSPAPIEDLYASYACKEARRLDWLLETPTFIGDQLFTAQDLSRFLKQWTGKKLKNVSVLKTVKANPALGFSNQEIVIAAAQQEDQKGFVVFDGEESAWYPNSENSAFHQRDEANRLLDIHIGHKILKYPAGQKTWDKKFPERITTRSPQETVAIYEKALEELPTLSLDLYWDITSVDSPLKRNLAVYLEAVEKVRGLTSDDALVALYDKLFSVATRLPPSCRPKLLDCVDFRRSKFIPYATTLVKNGKQRELLKLIDHLKFIWTGKLDRIELGRATFLAGDLAASEEFLSVIAKDEDLFILSFPAVRTYVTVLKSQGRTDIARNFLLTKLQLAKEKAQGTATSSDENQIRLKYRILHKIFCDEFPEEKQELEAKGLGEPELPLQE